MNLKRLERAWRAFWIRVITRLMARPRSVGAPDWRERPHRVLFLRHDRAGDMILSTAVIRAIACSQPTIVLDVLASPANASLLEANDDVRTVHVFDKRRLRSYPSILWQLRRARYDVVVDCMVTAPSLTTLLFMAACGAPLRVGIAGRGNDAAITVPVLPADTRAGNHMVDHLARLAAPFGVDVERMDRRPTLALTADERARADALWRNAEEGHRPSGPRFLVNVSAGTSPRLWPEERYVAVMRRLREHAPGARIRVIGAPAPDEQERAARIAVAGGGRLVATPGLREAVALVGTADFVFTPDTSIAHAAAAFRRPAVAMYIRGTSERWGLYGTIGRSLESSGPTLDSLPLDRVLAAIDSVIQEVGLVRSTDHGTSTHP